MSALASQRCECCGAPAFAAPDSPARCERCWGLRDGVCERCAAGQGPEERWGWLPPCDGCGAGEALAECGGCGDRLCAECWADGERFCDDCRGEVGDGGPVEAEAGRARR